MQRPYDQAVENNEDRGGAGAWLLGWGITALLGLGLLLYAWWIEPDWIEVKEHDRKHAQVQEPIRVAQLSDLHLNEIGHREHRIAQELERIKPHIVVLSGDVIDQADALPVLDAFLGMLGDSTKLAVLGNWEYWSGVNLTDLRYLYEEKHGVDLLVNQEIIYKIGSRRIRFVGLDDFTAGKPELGFAADGIGRVMTVLVQHSPGWFESAAAKTSKTRYDLCVSGHTHGGQVTLFGLVLYTPPGSGSYKAGFYKTASCDLYVSKGLGTSVLPFRLGARPEIAVFEF